MRDDYTRLYGHLLPELCETYAPDTYYWPSSPSSGGGFDDPDNPAKGDTHYWEVWHGGVPFTTYRQKRFRFCSEYGFESFPSMKTIRTFAREEDMNCFARVMENHQKCRGGNGKILRYLADNYLYPAAFENLVYASQLLQADAIKYGVEHFRRQRGYCMGSTYWQFNDCWPVAPGPAWTASGATKHCTTPPGSSTPPWPWACSWKTGRSPSTLPTRPVPVSAATFIWPCAGEI
mgnify:CR=1 FL=1